MLALRLFVLVFMQALLIKRSVDCTALLPNIRSNFTVENVLVAAGGWSGPGSSTKSIEIISLSNVNYHFTEVRDAPRDIAGFGSVIANNNVYILGGMLGQNGQNEFNSFVPGKDWKELSQFPYPIRASAMVQLGDNWILTLGGYADGYGYMNYAYGFDVSTRGWWRAAQPLPDNGVFPCAVAVGQSTVFYMVDRILYRSDDGAQTWSSLSAISTGRTGAGCIALESGIGPRGVVDTILVIGGYANGMPTDLVDMYSITTNTWNSMASLNKQRMGARAVALPAAGTSNVMVCGGYGNNSYRSDCEVYDWGTKQWTISSVALNTPRSYHGLWVGQIKKNNPSHPTSELLNIDEVHFL